MNLLSMGFPLNTKYRTFRIYDGTLKWKVDALKES